MNDQSQKLAATLDHAEWSWLQPHAQRDVLIVVANELDLVEVAQHMVDDDKTAIAGYVQKGQLTKPTKLQLDTWDLDPTRKFLSLIVQPYVLIQDITSH